MNWQGFLSHNTRLGYPLIFAPKKRILSRTNTPFLNLLFYIPSVFKYEHKTELEQVYLITIQQMSFLRVLAWLYRQGNSFNLSLYIS